MLKPGLETSEGKKSLGIIVAGVFFIFYILRHRYASIPPIEDVLANANSAVDIAKTYALYAKTNSSNVSGDTFDVGAIIAFLFGIYKTFSKYSDDRVCLKKEELKVEAAKTSAAIIYPTVAPSYVTESIPQPVNNTQSEEAKKF